ncbi:MAG: flagellar hook-basal body complex protein [Lachnospiraceae bacterium]|nr:flagellar hook-basal body complex protein [Ruminococcus sp.]MCM1273840.1 flagellar hook-basal body complex protein [Lachnospiraceae bacterium]
MVKSLYTGVSGLKTHQQRMDVIGNNIANVNTVGYKTDVVTFADVYYQTKRSPSAATSTLGGVNPRQVGYGVKVNSVTANMTQSGFTFSDKKTDLAIDGEGFFQVMDGSGNIRYTRAGDFYIDDNGYLLNADGYHVLGVTGNSDGVQASSEIIRIVVPDTNAHVSSATKMVNGTNVTISVTAPSDYTDMSVSFQTAEFPYATYANNILTVYFNPNMQYNSEEDFQNAVNQALQAGGINLPDDVEIEFEFEEVPNDTNAKAASNKVEEIKFTTDQAYVDFIWKDTANNDAYYYAKLASSDKESTTKISFTNGGTGSTTAVYSKTAGTLVITLGAEPTMTEINKAISDAIDKWNNDNAADQATENITCTGWRPGNDLAKFVTGAALGTAKALKGEGLDAAGKGGYDLKVVQPGEFANAYRINFAYSSTMGTTKATWDENTLTITVSDTSTIADVNKAIKEAAKGNEYKLLHFDNINGLDYGDDYKTFKDTYPDATTTGTDHTKEANKEIWNSGLRKAFFGGNPSVTPKDGKDSFYTETAKKLATFALEGGRTGEEQPLKSVTDLAIQNDGTIIGYHAVHGYMVFGRIDIALFDNPNGLAKVGGTNFAETVASGAPRLTVAGQGGAGVVLNGTLEMSNVDLADEFTNMITTQRGYQANSRVVTVSDTMIEELLNLKR